MNAITQSLIDGQRLPSGRAGRKTPATNIADITKTLRLWGERARQRRQLSGLTLRELDDVGISVEAAAAEAAKPFWRA